MNKYAYSGRPVLIKNAAKNWKAMEKFNFEFFKDLYAGLPNTPVLYNGVDGYGSKDCQFFAWKSEGKHHLNSLHVIMPLKKLNFTKILKHEYSSLSLGSD